MLLFCAACEHRWPHVHLIMTESEVDKCLRLATNTLFNSVCRISLASHVFDTKRSQVQFMTDTEVEVFPPSPAPSSDDYVGCYNDMVGDRLLTTVDTYDALTPAVSVTSRATGWGPPYTYSYLSPTTASCSYQFGWMLRWGKRRS